MLAGIADLLLIFAGAAGIIWLLVIESDLGVGAMPLAYALTLLLAFVQYFLLPSVVGASIGQLLFDLTVIRCADATRPRIRDIGRAMTRNPSMSYRIRGIHALAPHLVTVRRRDLTAHRADPANNPLSRAPVQPPEYHGAEGDPRYPSSRDLRRSTATVLDVILVLLAAPAVGLIAAMYLDTDTEIAMVVAFWVLLPLQLVALPVLIGSTLGQFLCGLTQIRGSDGQRPTLRDVIGIGNTLPTDIRTRGDLYVTVMGLVLVRRRDLAPVEDRIALTEPPH